MDLLLKTVAAFETVKKNDQGREKNAMASTASRDPWSSLFMAQRGPGWAIITKKQNNAPCVDYLSWREITLPVIQGARNKDKWKLSIFLLDFFSDNRELSIINSHDTNTIFLRRQHSYWKKRLQMRNKIYNLPSYDSQERGRGRRERREWRKRKGRVRQK